jgi:2-polyprenyl-3-methyl-5-hydroxy-6-metoxy-1,4-benzoquinol methylase
VGVVQPEGNYTDKYNYKNPIAKYLVSNFLKSLEELLKKVQFSSLYEPGCGEGYISKRLSTLYPTVNILSSDLSAKVIKEAGESSSAKNLTFAVESIYNSNHPDISFDIVVACEVLEHLEEPEKALLRLIQASKKYLLLSVPREPIWRLCNIARGSYLKEFGNTPGHIQHWSKRGFCRFVERYCNIIEVKTPFPWTMILSEKREK